MIATAIPNSTVSEATAWYIQGALIPQGQPQRIPVPSGRLLVGRRPDLNLCIPHASVSKFHAELIASEVALFVRDTGSTNGTFVNGVRISQDTPIGETDVVRFSDFEFVIGRTKVENHLCTMASAPEEWQSTLAQFQRLLTGRTVVPYFQPIIRFSDIQIIGYEVLARSSVEGLRNPKQMFEAAERMSLAARLSVLCRETGVDVAKKIAHPGMIFLNTHPCERPHAGLIESRREERSIIYSANFSSMMNLIAYLTENCCGGMGSCATSCDPTPKPKRRKS